jgi:hypothetical protein
MKFQKEGLIISGKNYYKIGGIILVIGCIQFLLAINLAEIFFPGTVLKKTP